MKSFIFIRIFGQDLFIDLNVSDVGNDHYFHCLYSWKPGQNLYFSVHVPKNKHCLNFYIQTNYMSTARRNRRLKFKTVWPGRERFPKHDKTLYHSD